MMLFKYYKLKYKLPEPDGPFSRFHPSSSILVAKDGLNDGGKRGLYSKLSAQIQAEIAKYIAEDGVTTTV